MKKLTLLLSIFLYGILSACAAGTPTAGLPNTPAIDLPVGSPPPATLEIDGTIQTAGVGTFCWNNETSPGEGVGMCVDKIGIPTASDPLKTSSPVKGHLTLPLNDPPSQLSLSIFPASSVNELPETVGGYRWWSYVEGYVSKLELQTSQDVQTELEPGLYVFYVFAVWDGLGDVSYGFLVEVE